MATLTCMRTRRTSQHGFSLLEVLITIGVLAVGLIAMARFQVTVLQGSSLARERSEAVAFAEQKIEQMRNYRDIVSNIDSVLDFPEIFAASPPPLTPSNCAATVETDASGKYTRTCTSSGLTTSSDYSRITVTVRVVWSRPGASEADTTVTLSSIITNANPRYSGEVT